MKKLTKLIIKNLTLFWDDIIDNLENQHILIIFRLNYEDGSIKTIGNLQRLNKEDLNYFIDYIKDIIELKTDDYLTIPVTGITISYGFRKGLTDIKMIDTKNVKMQKYYNSKLPISFNPKDYGKILTQINDNYYIVKIDNKTFVIINQITDESNYGGKYNLVEFYKNNNLLYKWKDIFINDNEFIREIGKSVYNYEFGELTLHKIIKPGKIISTIKKSRNVNNKIITMDLETITESNVMSPYLLCWHDGSKSKSYFIKDYTNFDKLLEQVVIDLCRNKYKGYKIYFHNFAKFDGIFLVTRLANIPNIIVDPCKHDGKFISVNITYNNISLTFRDSLLLLKGSLKALGKSFNCSINKDIFPIKFNDIDYIGNVPDIKYFNNINELEYLNYKDKFSNKEWNFKEESIKYCIIDCITLYEILIKFNQLIFEKFHLNINNYPTLPSLAFANYRCNYLEDDLIVGLFGEVFNDIKKSYTGGAVDMYIPINNYLEKVYCYDVNSLYPFIMKTCDMPIGKATFFEGDILKYDIDAFGFFNVEVTTPDNLLHPIIQIHHKTNDGIRTVAPLGRFETMLFSEELKNAIKYGYKFTIKSGYLFSRAKIFNNIINDLYNIRTNYPKSDPMNYIAKLLMNSLYGRFGMDDQFTELNILDQSAYNKFESKFKDNIIGVTMLGDKYLVNTKNTSLDVILDNGSMSHNVNIAIASAITSYSRIHMSQFKNNPNYKLFYTDTDSIYINKPLDDDFISDKKLGKMKLEFIADKAIFIAPKVYGLITNDNRQIIKIKGLKDEAIKLLNLNDLESLLYKNNILEISTNKWYRDINIGNISIKDQIYSLKVTSNKRILIYFIFPILYLKDLLNLSAYGSSK